jgi:hypothetical protein
MRPSSSDHSAAQVAGDVHRDRGTPQRPPDPPVSARRKVLGDARERAARGERTSYPATPVGDGEPVRGRPVTNSRRGSATRDYGTPHGHVIGRQIGGPPPRPRDPNRPAGRIGPYGHDVVVEHDVRPLLTHVVVRHDLRPLFTV